MTNETPLQQLGKRAKRASAALNRTTDAERNEALRAIAQQLRTDESTILEANALDVTRAREKGTDEAVIDRILLNADRLEGIAEAAEQIANLANPLGRTIEQSTHDKGFTIEKVTVPLGVIGMVYEARPNVTVDAAALCLKTGNAVLLRGSSSALDSNKALVASIQRALEGVGLTKDAVLLIEDTSYDVADELFQMNEYVDVLIPRGSQQLIQNVIRKATIPVIETGAGNCHMYIDEAADEEMALDLVLNAKLQRPSVCNAIETVLVHDSAAERFGARLVDALREKGTELYSNDAFVGADDDHQVTDWDSEFLREAIRVKRVASLDEALDHIASYSTQHSEAIVTEDQEAAARFLQEVDAAAVYHNVSTRFTDGFEYGYGAEMGISTQKLHARGPMGLEALTSTKFLIQGNGQTRG